MQFNVKGWFCISVSREVLWFRPEGGRCYMVKTPLHKPLFSERYGYWPHRRVLGFRFGSRP